MRIRVLFVGRGTDPYLQGAMDQLVRRIRRFQPLELVRIKGRAGRTAEEVRRGLARDAEALLRRIHVRDRVVLLEAGPRSPTSAALAAWLRKRLHGGAQSLCFVIGGAEGVDPVVRERADETLSLTPLTLSHDLARLVLLEQIDRALALLDGRAYPR